MNKNELMTKVETSVSALNVALQGNDAKVIANAKEKAKTDIEELNKGIVEELNAELLTNENPMLKAIKQCYYTSYCLKIVKDKDTLAESAELSTNDLNVIDICHLERMAKKQLSINGQWIFAIEKLSYLLAVKVGKEFNSKVDITSDYKMSQASKEFDLKGELTSNTQIAKAIQTIVDMIQPDLKVLNCDAKFMTQFMTKRGKSKLSVKLPQKKTMVKLLTEVMHRMVIQGVYTLEF